jgi:hypothetical protein
MADRHCRCWVPAEENRQRAREHLKNLEARIAAATFV